MVYSTHFFVIWEFGGWFMALFCHVLPTLLEVYFEFEIT